MLVHSAPDQLFSQLCARHNYINRRRLLPSVMLPCDGTGQQHRLEAVLLRKVNEGHPFVPLPRYDPVAASPKMVVAIEVGAQHDLNVAFDLLAHLINDLTKMCQLLLKYLLVLRLGTTTIGGIRRDYKSSPDRRCHGHCHYVVQRYGDLHRLVDGVDPQHRLVCELRVTMLLLEG